MLSEIHKTGRKRNTVEIASRVRIFDRPIAICAKRLKTRIAVVPISPEIERKAGGHIPDKFETRSEQSRIPIGIHAARKNSWSGLVDIGCTSAEHKVVDVRFESANRITKIFCTEVRYSLSEEPENSEIALVAEVVLPDHTAADAVRIRRTNMIVSVTPRTSVNVLPLAAVTCPPLM